MERVYFLAFLCILQSYLFWKLKKENLILKSTVEKLQQEKETLAQRVRDAQ